MSVIVVAADRDPPAESASGAHRATLERAFVRIYAVFMALMMAVFRSSSATLAGNRPGAMVADVLLSALLAGQTIRALRRLPSQQDLWLMVAATGSLLLVSRMLAVPRRAHRPKRPIRPGGGDSIRRRDRLRPGRRGTGKVGPAEQHPRAHGRRRRR